MHTAELDADLLRRRLRFGPRVVGSEMTTAFSGFPIELATLARR